MARYKVCFWLDANKDNELQLLDEIAALKRGRRFTETIRDGLRLMLDLRRGNTGVLFELFPDLRAKLTPPKSEDGGGELSNKIERLEQLILQQGSAPLVAQKRTGPLPIDDTPLEIKKDTKTDSAQNFLNSLMALQG